MRYVARGAGRREARALCCQALPGTVNLRVRSGAYVPQKIGRRTIALTRRVLEPFTVHDGDVAAVIGDESGLLQRTGDDRYRRAAPAEHHGDELRGEGKFLAA